MRPADPVVLIAGATGTLGRVAAHGFAADGWRLGLVGRNAARLADLAASLGVPEERRVEVVADVRNGEEAHRAVETVTSRFGRVDALLQVIGGFLPGAPVLEIDPADLSAMLEQHLWTTLHLARAAVPPMVEAGFGRVLAVTSSTTATQPAKASVYAMTKTAQETLLRVLAKEVAGTGVTVNVVAVRHIDTEHAREREPSPKNAGWTTPEEIVATFRFLCSDAASAINGARIPLDGRT